VGSRDLIAQGRALRRRVTRDAAPGTAPALASATPELRLVGVSARHDAVRLDVEILPSPVFATAPWVDHAPALGVHTIAADGTSAHWDGPRSQPFDGRWLHLRPAVRSVVVPRALVPEGGRVVVDLVVEGEAWGSARDVAVLVVDLAPAPVVPPAARPPSQLVPWPEPLTEVIAHLAGAGPEGADPAEMLGYATADAARFVLTAQLALADGPRRALEIGSNPYFMSRLLRGRDPELELAGTNWFGAPGVLSQDVVDHEGTVVATFRSDLFDVETHPFPHGDGSFDLVLFCEVIEHLVADPVHAVREIHRVLQPGGRLVLTTPNVARAANVTMLVQQRSIYDPFSRHGLHGRHNREYSAEELFDLLAGNGFEVVRHLTRPVHGRTELDAAWWAADDDDGHGDYHFVEAVRRDPTAVHRPPWLYR
jgi:SAM-dependent methyltransferase